jgi:beta-glucosidase
MSFLFGVCTASHQNEGYNTNNNWYDWEIKNNLELSDIACNSWNNYENDIKNIVNLKCDSYRFSIEWSRIIPMENSIDFDAINKYKNIINYCINNNITPIITLHHFTRPIWFDNKYEGLHSKFFLEKFTEYIKIINEHLLHLVKFIITFNEPYLECVNGYIKGTRPPGYKSDFKNMFNALCNILDTHSTVYRIIKRNNPLIQISISKNIVYFKKQYKYDYLKSYIENNIIENFNYSLLNAFYTGTFNFGFNIYGINKKYKKQNLLWMGTLDFLGINHYNVGYVNIKYLNFINFKNNNAIDVKLLNPNNNIDIIKNSLNWEIDINSMKNILTDITNKYGMIPIMITENGSCDYKEDGFYYQKYIIDYHLKSVMDFYIENKNILGYMWWTLQDNFEWDDGYDPKFGLYTRIKKNNNITGNIKEIGKYYREIISKYKSYISI